MTKKNDDGAIEPAKSAVAPTGAAFESITWNEAVEAPIAAVPIPVPARVTAPAVTMTIEQWAEAKGLIRPGWEADNRYVSRHPSHRHFAPQHFNVAKFMQGWAIGRELTEADFDAGIAAARDIKLS